MRLLATKFLLNLFISIGLFCVSFYVAWQVCASMNFLYPLWYEVIDIETAITKYAPHNKNRQGFENTNKKEQVRLFSAIVEGIQNNGMGLDQLKYTNAEGVHIDTLLTKAEIIHLTDVARLVNKFKYFAIAGFLIAVIAFFVLNIFKSKLAKIRYHIVGGIGLVAFLMILVLFVGPKKVFYSGHDLIFPNNHQWFFYYEDSLMSTMMKAPALFAPIAAELLFLIILFWALLLLVFQKTQQKIRNSVILKPK